MRSFTRLATFAAIGVAISLSPSSASTAGAQDPKKICLERYNLEKEGGTIPVGMTKAKYMSQCTNSIRRQAKLEQELNEQAATNGSNTTTGTNKTSFTSPNSSVGANRDQ
jgi:hypothetical protein